MGVTRLVTGGADVSVVELATGADATPRGGSAAFEQPTATSTTANDRVVTVVPRKYVRLAQDAAIEGDPRVDDAAMKARLVAVEVAVADLKDRAIRIERKLTGLFLPDENPRPPQAS